jgi:hypothetical protein
MAENRDDGGKITAVDEEDRERELAEQCSPDWVGLDRKLPGILCDAIKDRIQLGEEARHQGGITRLIPRQRIIDVELCARLNDEAAHNQRGEENLRSSSARTSLQGRPTVGLAR